METNYIARHIRRNLLEGSKSAEGRFARICYGGQEILFYRPEDLTESFCIRKGGMEFTICMKKYPEFGAVDWQMTATNHSDEPSRFLTELDIAYLGIPLPPQEPLIHKGILGDSCTGESFLPFTNNVEIGDSISIRPKNGKSSQGAFPFFDICGPHDGLICGIGWSGTWFYELSRDKDGFILKSGLPDVHFYMEPHESLRFPRILLMAYEGDAVAAHNRFRRLMKEYFSPKRRFGDQMKMPMALQNFDRYSYKIPQWNTTSGQMQEIDYAERCAYFDVYWMDAAWFAGGFPKGVGNYSFREGLDGLSSISKYAHEKGLRTMVWFEPERVYRGTETAREHPEFLLRGEPGEEDAQGFCMDGIDPMGCAGMLLDLSNPEAVDWITELVAGFIEENRIDIYRQDFNLYPDTYWAKKDSADRKGITEIKYMEGLYRFWDTLLERFPHLLIDNCASGGNRIDLESCARSVFCWRSDTGCYPVSESMKTALWNQNQNLALSSYIVYHAIASWDPSAYDMRSAMSNGLAGSFDVRSPACDFERIHVALAECERLRKYWEEDFYPLSEADLREDHWSMCQFGSQDSGVLLAFRREKDREERHTIALQGLDMDSDYLVRISDEEHHMVERIVSAGSLAAGYAFELKRPGSSLAMEYIRQ